MSQTNRSDAVTVTKRTGISRRWLLGRSAVGLAAGMLGGGIPSPASATRRFQLGANEKVGVGYIGVGRRARQLMGLPRAARIVAVADVDSRRADEVAAERKCRSYHDYRALLDDKDVDAVVIATPDHWHVIPAIHACQAGKDVYCEKPLSLTVREGRMLVRAARKYERVVQTGSQQRSMSANRVACELVRQGQLGKLKEVIGYNYPGPWECRFDGQDVPEGLDWNWWCGPSPLLPYHAELFRPRGNPGWISFRPFSGGEMTGWGAHGLDQVQWALGMDHSGPVEVWTEGEPFRPPVYTKPESRKRGEAVCSRPLVRYRYETGVVLTLADGPPGGATFVGERGRITIDRGRFRLDPPDLIDLEHIPVPSEAEGTDGHLRNWIACIRSRQRPAADVEIGHRSATVCHLGNIARWTGRRLQWDPREERFVGDAAANRLLDRPRRPGFELPEIT